MKELSAFKTMSPITVLRYAELEHALHKYFGNSEAPAPPRPFGFGVYFAMRAENRMLKLTMRDDYQPAKYTPFCDTGKVKQLELELTVKMEFEILRGPDESETKLLREKYNYKPEEAEEIARKRAKQEEDLKQRLITNPKEWKNLDNIVTANYLYWELFDSMPKALQKTGMTMQDFVSLGHDKVTQFVHDIPIADVSIALHKANLKNLNRAWKKNDVHDMDALAIAVPYCDIVVTEKHAVAQLKNTGIEQNIKPFYYETFWSYPKPLIEY